MYDILLYMLKVWFTFHLPNVDDSLGICFKDFSVWLLYICIAINLFVAVVFLF